jgi:threonine dehydrogenase-like Zn-dependent dehydrogenase
VVFSVMRSLGRNGVLGLLGISGGRRAVTVPGAEINLELVLGNNVVFGSVNASRRDFERGAEHLALFERHAPGAMERLITRRVPLTDYQLALTRRPEDVKTVVEVTQIAATLS